MRKMIGITILGLLAAALVSGCDVGEAKTAQPADEAVAAALPVAVASAQIGDIYATYETTTTISSESEAPVLARVAGEVVEILVEEGEQVETGQVLARLDGERLRLQMLQAKAMLDKAEKEYQRLINLHERGLVSAASFDGLKYDLESLKASYELQRLNYGYTTIRASIDGVISSRDIKLGQHLNVNDPAFRITDTSLLVAYLKIPQTELEKFSAGHEAEIRVDAMPGTMFAATISRISPTIDVRNGTFRATAYLDNADGRLAPGMFGRFSIAYEKHENALLIPEDALLREDGEDVVYVVVDGAAERRVVETGVTSDDHIEILQGLTGAEQIIVTGHGGLRDGSRVLASNDPFHRISG
jgi:membrane fusion protein (multidrug efflux system)